jgi:hypothetical protein
LDSLKTLLKEKSSTHNKKWNTQKLQDSLILVVQNIYDYTVNKLSIRKFMSKYNFGHSVITRILNENNRITSETKITDSLYIQTIKINEK